MIRGWSRAGDRRRGVSTLLGALAAAPWSREARCLRERFERELGEILNAREIELRDGPAMPCPPDNTISLDVSCGDLALGAIDATFDEGAGAFDEWDRQVIESARHVAGLVLLVDRAQRSGLFGTARGREDGAAPIVGSSVGIRAVRERIERVAVTDFTVLIEGESGSGKELVARQIHELSPRSGAPFVAVNCAAIVETLLEAELFGIEDRTATGVRGRRGKFEHAHEGTLFLDEVGDLSPAAQAKLLRVIQEMTIERVGGTGGHRVNVRIIAATNQKLSDLVSRGRFRLDLFYRLHGVEITVPPLKERPEDILELAEYFLERHRPFRRLRLSQAASDALLAYPWPGNVRELQRVIERGVALADTDQLRLDDLPPALLDGYIENLPASSQRIDSMRAWGSRYARLVLERCENNKRRACRELGISYHTLQGYLRYRPEMQPPNARGAGDGYAAASGAQTSVAGLPPANNAGAGKAGQSKGCVPDRRTLNRESHSGGLQW
jgi:DNA-binding NtrC family response regulator